MKTIKTNNIKRYIRNFIEYLKNEAHIVLLISIFCIFWIFLYKLWFTSEYFTELLFPFADKVGDIVYTVFSSIVAAGVFYYVTVYLPKRNAIEKMRKYIISDLRHFESMNEALIMNINIGDTIKKYTLVEFPKWETDINFNNAKTDFINYFMRVGNLEDMQITFNYMMKCIEPVYFNYSNIFPQEINIILNTYRLKGLNLPYELYKGKKGVEVKVEVYEDFFAQLIEGLMLSEALKVHYKLKL